MQQPTVTQAPTGQQTITEATTSVTSVPSVTQQQPLPNRGYGPQVPISETKNRPLEEAKTYRPPTPRREDSLIPHSAVTPVEPAQSITPANPATFSAVSGTVPGSQDQAIRQAAPSEILTTNNLNPGQKVYQQQRTTGDLINNLPPRNVQFSQQQENRYPQLPTGPTTIQYAHSDAQTFPPNAPMAYSTVSVPQRPYETVNVIQSQLDSFQQHTHRSVPTGTQDNMNKVTLSTVTRPRRTETGMRKPKNSPRDMLREDII